VPNLQKRQKIVEFLGKVNTPGRPLRKISKNLKLWDFTSFKITKLFVNFDFGDL